MELPHLRFISGNSDILANVVYKEGKELLDIIIAIKKLAEVERIVWSERIYSSPLKKIRVEPNLLNSFRIEF